MKIADIQRELKNRGVDPKIIYYLSNLQEQILAQGEMLDDMAQLLQQLCVNVGNLTELSHSQAELLHRLKNPAHKQEGMVESVLPDDDEG